MQQVTICGPNLRDQTKGTFHVHAAGCQDLRNYGPEGRLGGEDKGWTIAVNKPIDIVWAVYADHLDEGYAPEEQDETADSWLSDFWFAPCVKDLA